MMRPFHRSYMTSWSSRRESVGLMGAFLVFLIGLPGHSETMVNSTRHLVRQLIELIMVFLGLSIPNAQMPVTVMTSPVMTAPKVHRARFADPNSMYLRTDPILHRYIYIFKGKATLQGEACPKASVLVRLLAGDITVTKGAVAEEDGSYSIEVPIDAEDRAPVDWVMEAYTPDFKKVELSGRQIVQREERPEEQEVQEEPGKKPIIVTNPVEFVVSYSK